MEIGKILFFPENKWGEEKDLKEKVGNKQLVESNICRILDSPVSTVRGKRENLSNMAGQQLTPVTGRTFADPPVFLSACLFVCISFSAATNDVFSLLIIFSINRLADWSIK